MTEGNYYGKIITIKLYQKHIDNNDDTLTEKKESDLIMKHKLRIAMLVVSILLMILPTGIFASDTAAEADLVITTAEELAAFRDDVNSGNHYIGMTVVLAADIDLEESGVNTWQPIGINSNYAFAAYLTAAGMK